MSVVRETEVSALGDGGNNVGMLATCHATRAAIAKAEARGFSIVGVTSHRRIGDASPVCRRGKLGVNLPRRVSPRSELPAVASGAGVYRRQQPRTKVISRLGARGAKPGPVISRAAPPARHKLGGRHRCPRAAGDRGFERAFAGNADLLDAGSARDALDAVGCRRDRLWRSSRSNRRCARSSRAGPKTNVRTVSILPRLYGSGDLNARCGLIVLAAVDIETIFDDDKWSGVASQLKAA